ncbi:alpha/beta hydrolase [Agromyces sp. SYSU T0242]|uniref:alpha/beta hydrolase n=1 Tax=Agromyces litoreus TaxID=3158561 RepID=UPI0033985863
MGDAADWRPDVLGPGFEQLTLPLGSDDEGEVVATLVRYRPGGDEHDGDGRARRWRWPWQREPERDRPPAASGCDVLYVHGWSDYFFNPELARFWEHEGARFFALDLRKYGRSLREWQTPGYATDLAVYDQDVDAALAVMRDEGADGDDAPSPRPLILLGHSTGGLTLSLWAARHPGRAAALVLNAPWLEFQLSGIGRQAIQPMIGFRARLDPMGPLPNVDLGFYTRSVAHEQDGEWEYDHAWRPDRGFRTHPAWLTAILAGHATIAAGVEVGCPVLTVLSARSTLLPRWDPAMLTSDIVLVVDEIAERSLKLGRDVTVARIEGALHDAFLSREPARSAAYAAILRWLRGYAPAGEDRAR